MNRYIKLVFSVLFLLVVLASIGPTDQVTAAPPTGESYIIVFADSVDLKAAVPDVAIAYGLRVGYVYEHALKGMSATVPAGRLLALRHDPRVAYVEADRVVTLDGQTIPTGIRRIFANGNSSLDIDGIDDFRVDVDVAVIDTGVDFQHPDLNVAGGVDCTVYTGGGAPWIRNYYCSETAGTGGDDNHYHGTHVAGTIAALDNDIGVVGVAPGARIWAVKVLNASGSGYTSGIVAGIDWIAGRGDIEVANMSLGGSGYSQAEYDAIERAVNAGVAFAVSAGNEDDDASDYSPAAFDNVLTVSALADFDGLPGYLSGYTCRIDQDDTLADFSNWGEAVQITAPGVCILSTFPLEQGEYGTISGTSMASPHVAGALALLASLDNPDSKSDVEKLYSDVIAAGNSAWTDDSGDGNQEPLLDVSTFGATLIENNGGGGGTNTPPMVTIKSPSDGASFTVGDQISFLGSASDVEDGDLSADLIWTSNMAGQIGIGASVDAALGEGTHTITASVSDSAGNESSDSITISVVGGSGGDGISLSVSAEKIRGRWYANLSWTGAAATLVDIYRDETLRVPSTANDGEYQDPLGKSPGTTTYKVCEADSAICSDTKVLNW